MNKKVSIVMSIYKPNMQWLKEQLVSLNNLEYDNLNLFVRNDCPDDKYNYEEYISRYITQFPFVFLQGEHNLGVSKAFEKLTELADGEYIAYCDQDDRWLPEKIKVLVKYLEANNLDAVASNMYAIDDQGNRIMDKFLDKVPNIKNDKKEMLMEFLKGRISCYGCTMLAKRESAVESLPFPNTIYGYHDIFLALYIIFKGKFAIYDVSLIEYRRHEKNLSEVLSKIDGKTDYLKRLNDEIKFFFRLEQCFKEPELIALCRRRYEKKQQYFSRPTLQGLKEILQDEIFSHKAKSFAVIYFLPDWMFEMVIKIAKIFMG